jgi:hypothetical protein
LEISVVMPCLNEAATVRECVVQAIETFDALGIAGEVIVADNGSTDGSQAIAAEAGARVVDVPRRGYGSALLGGFAAARGEFIVMGDADRSYDFSSIGPFIDRLRAGEDLVVGNRFKGGIEPGAMPWLHRYVGNPVLTAIGKVFFRSSLGDFHCGLRAFRRAALERLDLKMPGMELASEMIVKAELFGLAVAEVPTTLAPDGRDRAPHLRTWRDGWRHLRFLFLFTPRWALLYPGALLMLVGIVVGGIVLTGPTDIGSVTLDVHTFLYAAAAIVIGFQAMVFAAFARVFAMVEGFLPEDQRLRRAFRFLRLETGLLAGAVLLTSGFGLSVYALAVWGDSSFGELDYQDTMRVVIPAVVLLILGCQTILSSLFFSILGFRDTHRAR